MFPEGARNWIKGALHTRCEGGEAVPRSSLLLLLLRGAPKPGLGAGLPQGLGEVVCGDPGGTQQSHHVQAEREEDAEQRD